MTGKMKVFVVILVLSYGEGRPLRNNDHLHREKKDLWSCCNDGGNDCHENKAALNAKLLRYDVQKKLHGMLRERMEEVLRSSDELDDLEIVSKYFEVVVKSQVTLKASKVNYYVHEGKLVDYDENFHVVLADDDDDDDDDNGDVDEIYDDDDDYDEDGPCDDSDDDDDEDDDDEKSFNDDEIFDDDISEDDDDDGNDDDEIYEDDDDYDEDELCDDGDDDDEICDDDNDDGNDDNDDYLYIYDDNVDEEPIIFQPLSF